MTEKSIWPPPGLKPLPIDVVSVQSQVVYGRVGNNVAVPVLQAHELAVAAVPTVVLGNLPHYPTMHGGPVPIEWFAGYLEDLRARGSLGKLRAVLSGFLGSPAQAGALGAWIAPFADSRRPLVVIDPVIGDRKEGVYVDPGLVDAYRRGLLELADGLLPNEFELSRLAGGPIIDAQSALAAARSLLVGHTQWVAVTSALPGRWPDHRMQLLLATREQCWRVTHARVDAEPKGAGDLFAAVLTARLLRGDALTDAVCAACRRVIQALRRTQRAGSAVLLLPEWSAETELSDDVRIEALDA
ncbi:MAG TPA: pyridoxine/pyridoxal/pyridoxamine kinase [Nevskiaceae bacterium]